MILQVVSWNGNAKWDAANTEDTRLSTEAHRSCIVTPRIETIYGKAIISLISYTTDELELELELATTVLQLFWRCQRKVWVIQAE